MRCAKPITIVIRARRHQAPRCGYCHDLVAHGGGGFCAGCHLVLHDDCVPVLKRCPTLGCSEDWRCFQERPRRSVAAALLKIYGLFASVAALLGAAACLVFDLSPVAGVALAVGALNAPWLGLLLFLSMLRRRRRRARVSLRPIAIPWRQGSFWSASRSYFYLGSVFLLGGLPGVLYHLWSACLAGIWEASRIALPCLFVGLFLIMASILASD